MQKAYLTENKVATKTMDELFFVISERKKITNKCIYLRKKLANRPILCDGKTKTRN